MNEPVNYLQCDSRWGKIKYAVKGENVDICHSGCGPTSMAMVLATWVDKKITPKETSEWALKNGFKALRQGTYYSYFKAQAKVYGINAYQLNGVNLRKNPSNAVHSRVLNELKKGNLVIACMGKGLWTNSGHFVLLYDIDVDKDIVYVNDPASTSLSRTQGSWKRLQREVKYYFVVEKPEGGIGVDKRGNQEASSWAKEAREWVMKEGISDGNSAKASITREQVWTMLHRFYKLILKVIRQ